MVNTIRQVEHVCTQVSAGGHVLWQCLPCGFPAGAALTITCMVTIVSALISPMAGRRSAAIRSRQSLQRYKANSKLPGFSWQAYAYAVVQEAHQGLACPFLLHGHKMLTLSIWVAEASHARLAYSTQRSYGCLLGSGSFQQWDRSRTVTPPFKVSDSARNFPPSISLSSGGALALSADTGPSAVAAELRHAGKVCYPLRCN